MDNELSFLAPHKSITSFDSIVLPKFVVLTGRNGSGKTHLLTGIKSGKIKSSLVNNIDVDVRIFDSTTIVPTDTGVFDPSQEQSRRSQWFNTIQTQREQYFPSIQAFVQGLGVPASLCTNIFKINSLDIASLREVLANPENAENVYSQIVQHLKSVGTNIYSTSHGQIGDDYWRKTTPKIQQIKPESFVVASHAQFFEDENFLWGEVDPFQQAFGRVFITYRDLIHSNDRLQKYPPKDDPNRRFLSADEFNRKHGEPPWNFVNRILEECALDFRVDHPPLHEVVSYEPKLDKISTTVEMRFQDLSSGEKVLMSFALCLYNSQENRQEKVFPKLLLLDEVDAPLHPSMVASLLKTIQNVLVRDKNVSVILTTHSPSTVALAPEDAIYAMNLNNPRLEKISKNSALLILTAGVPTLSVSFSGRRQVFVESRTDASLYDKLYQTYKNYFQSGRSLIFIEVGNSDRSGQESNSGCGQVVRLVESLSDGGNESVYGLVDWDGKRTHTSRVRVLSPGIRDGLESLIFDPVLLFAIVVRENLGYCREILLISDLENYFSLLSFTNERWQSAVDAIQRYILGDFSASETILVKYLNGMTLEISKQYLHLDDHKLEATILNVFGFLMPKNKRAGGLMNHCIDTVLADNALLMPTDLLNTFNDLLGLEQILGPHEI